VEGGMPEGELEQIVDCDWVDTEDCMAMHEAS
jgi:hypothetical protein